MSLISALFLVLEFYKMPKLYHFDNYDECLNGEIHSLKNVYCYVDVVIRPNTSSSVWTIIEVCLKSYYLVKFYNV